MERRIARVFAVREELQSAHDSSDFASVASLRFELHEASESFEEFCTPERILALLEAARRGSEDTAPIEAAKNWQLYWDLYESLTTIRHYSPAEALSHLVRAEVERLSRPEEQPIYGPRAAFIIAAQKGAKVLDALMERRRAEDAKLAARALPAPEREG
jgi:hypothetical protein